MSIYEKIDRLFIERGASVYKEAEKLNFGPVNLAISDGSTRFIELVCDYSGFWSAKCVMHLRDNKYIHLTESESILLGIDCKNHMFYLIDFAKGKIHAQYLPHHHAYGDKPAYAIELNEGSDVMMRPCNVGELKRKFLRIV